jgi:hypothetical protein
MALTAHDILTDADLFRAAYPNWPGIDPLTGPFMTGRQLTDYRDMPGYAIPPREVPETDPGDSWLVREMRRI